MANNISGNPWYLDSTGSVFKMRFKFDGGLWTPAAPGGTLLAVDGTGRNIISLTADTVGANVPIGRLGWVNGLSVTTISGHLLLYVAYK